MWGLCCSYDETPWAHVPATTSQKWAFWVTNPSLQPFQAFAYWCANKDAINKLQISVLSSYGGVRVWRVDPYAPCPVINGQRQCLQSGSAGSVQLQNLDLEFNASNCDLEFNVVATGLDYINEDNIAVTVMRTTMANLNTQTLRPIDPANATYPILWLNPTTMEYREDRLWMPEAPSPALTAGALCPSQRRMPNLGSIAAEALVANLLFFKLPLNVLINLPVVLTSLDGTCPVMNRGHSLLQTCGADLLNLDDAWDAVFKLQFHFWNALAIGADGFGPGVPQTFVNGVAMAGENGGWAAMLPGMVNSLSAISKQDATNALATLQNTVMALPTPVQAAQLALKNPIAMMQFYYRAGSRMMMQVVLHGLRRRLEPGQCRQVESLGFEMILHPVHLGREIPDLLPVEPVQVVLPGRGIDHVTGFGHRQVERGQSLALGMRGLDQLVNRGFETVQGFLPLNLLPRSPLHGCLFLLALDAASFLIFQLGLLLSKHKTLLCVHPHCIPQSEVRALEVNAQHVSVPASPLWPVGPLVGLCQVLVVFPRDVHGKVLAKSSDARQRLEICHGFG